MVDAQQISECHCLHCGHLWIPRKTGKPVVCPRCKHYDWDKEAGYVNVNKRIKRIKNIMKGA